MKRALKKFAAACLFAASAFAASGAGPALAEEHFLLSLYHFNLQYVAGDREAEDKVIVESFAPLVDLYLKHPDWGGSFEMQGYMLEAMGERTPDVLEKFKTLVNRGQVELVCFHYSDQLFLAYPKSDMEWSERLNQAAFQKAGVRPSPVVFTQEGQFGEGMAPFMLEHGRSIGLMAKNHFKGLFGDGQPDPYYDLHGLTTIVVGRGANLPEKGIRMDWTFFNDGELLATGNASPYMPEFKHKPEAVKAYEDRILAQTANGAKKAKVTDYVAALEQAGVPRTPAPPILDGTWQPDDTDNVYRWMGDYRSTREQDNLVLTSNVKSRRKLLAAEAAARYAREKGLDVSWEERGLVEGWRRQMFAEVSDSTGWMPFIGEVRYSLRESDRAIQVADKILSSVGKKLGMSRYVVDLKTGSLTEGEAEIKGETEPAPCPEGFLVSSREGEATLRCGRAADGSTVVEAEFTAGEGAFRAIEFSAPLELEEVVYSPALMEDRIVRYPLSAYLWDKWTLPLSNGLVGIGPGRWILKELDSTHLAAHIDKNQRRVRFIDALPPANQKTVWAFRYLEGDERAALDLADRLNLRPPVAFEGGR